MTVCFTPYVRDPSRDAYVLRIHPVSTAAMVRRPCALPFLGAASSTGAVRPGG